MTCKQIWNFEQTFILYISDFFFTVNVTNKRMRVCNDVTARFIISYRSLQCTIIHLHWKLHKGVVEFIARGVLKKKYENNIHSILCVFYVWCFANYVIMFFCFISIFRWHINSIIWFEHNECTIKPWWGVTSFTHWICNIKIQNQIKQTNIKV